MRLLPEAWRVSRWRVEIRIARIGCRGPAPETHFCERSFDENRLHPYRQLKNVASYPQWLQDVVKDCEEAKRKIVYHPLCKAMKDATLDIESTHRFLIGFFPVIEQFPQFMASNLMKARFGHSHGEGMARSYL